MLSTAGAEYDARCLWGGCSDAVGPPGLFVFRCTNRWLRHRQSAAATPWLGAPTSPGGTEARCRWRSHRFTDFFANSPGGTTAWWACSIQPVLSTTRDVCVMDARMLSALRACSFFVVPTGGFATGKELPPLRGLERRPVLEGRKLGAGGAAAGVLLLFAG
ncbi:hypothetical protein LF1_14020 [Rubripirellula obstinata]|uniref:Uncharacterized protein n=1 Tax=Rubripirellula obstinata TaxID=406547 RepID=A0A5B1CCH7_9BACT|nr:hypothetical protein LF1_14020 [Rubripirellula obstinata]